LKILRAGFIFAQFSPQKTGFSAVLLVFACDNGLRFIEHTKI
jgi:hypothetical protein